MTTSTNTSKQEYRDLVNLLVRIICKQIGIHKIPVIYYSPKDWHKVHRCNSKYNKEKFYGLTCTECKGIAVNLEARDHTSILELVNTIAHELAHLKFPDKGEGKEFENIIIGIVRGKRYK